MSAYTPIARFLFNEANSGVVPGVVADSVGSNDLTITYNSAASWTSNAAGNGLDFTGAAVTAGSALVVGSAVADNFGTAFSGATEASAIIECEIDSSAAGQQIFHIGSVSGAGYWRMTLLGANLVVIGWADEDSGGTTLYNRASFSSATLITGRCCFKLVVDTTQVAEADRVKLYKNNVLLTFEGLTNLAQNTALPTFGASHYISIGNNSGNSENVDGRVYFAEFGTGQLTGTQLGAANTALAADNDSDWSTGGSEATSSGALQAAAATVSGSASTSSAANPGIRQVCYQPSNVIYPNGAVIDYAIFANVAALKAGTVLASGQSTVAGGAGEIEIDTDAVSIGTDYLVVASDASGNACADNSVAAIDLNA